MSNEIWLPVIGFEGLYEVSNQGRIKSLPRIMNAESGQGYKGKMKTISTQKNGYARVNLHRNAKSCPQHVHRVVALAFIPNNNPEEKDCVNHKDGNKLN